MAKHSIENTPGFAFIRDAPYFPDDRIAAVIKAVNKRSPTPDATRLKNRLEGAAEALAINRFLQNQPSDKTTAKRFRKIEKQAVKLLEALGAGSSGGIGAIPGPIRDGLIGASKKKAESLGTSSNTLLREALGGVVFLRRAARRQAGELSGEIAQVGGHTGAKYIDQWIAELASTYTEVWKTKPGVSLNILTGEYGGPFFRFVVASSQFVGINTGNNAQGKRVQRVLRTWTNKN